MSSPIEKMLDTLDYVPTNAKPPDSSLPYVTHTGKLTLGDLEIEVCVLSNGQRIIPEDEMVKILGILPI